MKKFYYLSVLCFALLLVASRSYATKRKVLFIGNSYIYTNDMPKLLQQLATSMGDTLVYDQNTPGGYTMESHSLDATTITKIFSQPWDIVVLQEQSQKPSFPPAQVAVETYPFAHKLDSMVRKNNSCTETMFFMTWGYKNGDAGNCVVNPPVCTYQGMQMRLRDSYMQMSQDNNGIVAPVGAAFKVVIDSFPAMDLYSPDFSHPNIYGSYLETCVFYASIFHKSPFGASYIAGLPAADAKILQRIAAKVTLDSINNWIQYGAYPYSKFAYSINNKAVNFTNSSLKATSYAWVFGDGGNTTQQSPSHTYTNNGKYAVTLTASNTCFAEAKTDTVTIGLVSVQQVDAAKLLSVLNAGNGIVLFSLSNSDAYSLEIFDMNGKKVQVFEPSANSRVGGYFAPGSYFYRLTNRTSQDIGYGKFVSY